MWRRLFVWVFSIGALSWWLLGGPTTVTLGEISFGAGGGSLGTILTSLDEGAENFQKAMTLGKGGPSLVPPDQPGDVTIAPAPEGAPAEPPA